MKAERYLIVNADDFGFTEGINRGIVEAHERGILTAASLMANGPRFEHAVALARQCPTLDVGAHLSLVQGESLSRPGHRLPPTLGAMLRALLAGQLDPEEEFRAQLRRLVSEGIQPSHVDTHKHTHLHPRVLEAVLRVAEEFGIRWVRQPLEWPFRGWIRLVGVPVELALKVLRWGLERKLARYRCRSVDHFRGLWATGRLASGSLLQILVQLPAGVTELMCHPGYCTAELWSLPTRLKQSREQELQALIDPEVRRALEVHGVRLVNFRQLDAQGVSPAV